MRKRGVVASSLLVAVVPLGGCGGSSLEDDDPAGYSACQTYAEAAEITDDPLSRLGGSLDAGKRASEAKTDAIRSAANRVGDSWVADGDALEAACEANGFEIP